MKEASLKTLFLVTEPPNNGVGNYVKRFAEAKFNENIHMSSQTWGKFICNSKKLIKRP